MCNGMAYMVYHAWVLVKFLLETVFSGGGMAKAIISLPLSLSWLFFFSPLARENGEETHRADYRCLRAGERERERAGGQ